MKKTLENLRPCERDCAVLLERVAEMVGMR